MAGQRAWEGAVRLGFVTFVVLAGTALTAHAVQIDGRIDAQEWQGAKHVTDFRKTMPLNGEPASLATEAWILATPQGLAVAFRNIQPPSVPRTMQHVQRDFSESVDRINVMVDFDGDHRTGYDFVVTCTDGLYDAVITNENNFNSDWDGNWGHAVALDEEGWNVEVLIPWHIAPMRQADVNRTLNIYLARVIGSTGERDAWPQASFERPRFLSDFAPIEVVSYSQSLLAITPYVSGLYDNVGKSSNGDAGADIFWKPNGQTQLTATINPDFGQVESDDLVVNFSATETFISDKRPFFTENQGIFEFTTPSDFSQLLYTRRVGGPADDGNGAGDITGALKLNGSLGATKYGLFAADEAEAVGRTFAAARVVRDFERQNLGFMATWVDKPYYDRQATVVGIDHNWRPTARWNIRTRLFGSDIDEPGNSSHDTGATVWADYEMDHGWRQQLIAMHFGDELEIDDAGYLQRNNTNYLHYEVKRRFAELAETSRYSSKDWRWRVSSDHNDHGQLLNYQLRVSRESQLRNGSYEYGQVNINSAGYDDLLTRGNGVLWLPPNFNSYFDYRRPRIGAWAYELELNLFSGGLSGNGQVGYTIHIEPKYFISDAFNVYVGLLHDYTPDWTIWQQDNLIGSFKEHQTNFDVGFTWIMNNRHELRLKVQAIALSADLNQAYRVVNGGAVPTTEPVDDFSVQNLGVQLRYRYEFKPLSYLYVVYGRGGYEQDPLSGDTAGMVRDSFSLRDDEQLLVKFSYRFEN
jgi:Domain of unknown function (DUF5916)